MHSVTLLSAKPKHPAATLRNAGSPKPRAAVRRTENDPRSTTRSAEVEAILRKKRVYFLPLFSLVEQVYVMRDLPPVLITQRDFGHGNFHRSKSLESWVSIVQREKNFFVLKGIQQRIDLIFLF